jgi:hypothetical protein
MKCKSDWHINLYHGLLITDVNECANSQCDLASSECLNTAGAFHCRCRKGFAPNLECRPVGDLGLTTGGIPDDAITVSDEETDYDKTVISCFFIFINPK